MPRGFDSRQPQPDYNPLASKLSFNTADIASQAEAAFQTAMANFWNYTVEAFDMAIGIDPSTFLPATQTQLGGFGTTSSILSQLISVGGGNPNATDLLAEYAATFQQAITTGDWSGLLSSLYNETAEVLDTIWPGAVPALDASKITTGTLSPSLLPMISQTQITGLETSLGALLPNSTWQAFINGVVGGTAGDVNSLVSWLNGVDTAAYNAVTTGNYNGLLTALFGGTSVASTVIPSAVPGLDASKITTGTFAQSMITGLTTSLNTLLPTTTYQNLVDGIANALGHTGSGHTWTDIETYLGIIPAANLTGTLATTNIPSLDASKITTGTFAQSMVTGLTTSLNTLLPTTTYQSLVDGIANALGHTGTGHTWTDIETYLGIIPAANLTGALSTATVPGSQLTGSVASSLLSGLVALGLIPALPATQITSGTLSSASMVPVLDASKITTGTFAQSMISGLTSLWNSWFGTTTPTGTSTLAAVNVAALPASKITTGTFTTGLIPALDASKITTGTFAQSMVTGLTTSLNALLPTTTYQSLVDGIANALGHTGTGHTWTDIETYFGIIPAANLTGALSTATVPGSQLTGSVASSLLSGLVALGLIPSLPATQITSGTLSSASMVPNLDASKITTGTFAQSMVTGLTTSLNTLLPTTTYQSLVDGIANALGHTGTGHTWTDIETYFGIIPAANLTGALSTATVPGSQLTGSVASSLLSGLVALGLIPSLPASQITSGTLSSASMVPVLDASKITTGTFAQSMISGLTSLWNSWFGTTTPTGTSTLAAANVAPLPASQITSGIFGTGLIPALDASKITSGSLTGATVPGSQLTGSVLSSLLSGAVALGLIPALPATQITSGTLSSSSMVPVLDASKITTGTFGTTQIPNLAASKITSGTFTSAFLPIFGLKQLSGSNLVLDPGFENSTYWANASNNNGSQSTDYALSGTHSWKIPSPGPSGASILYLTNNDVGIVRSATRAGEIHQIEVWYYQPSTNLSNTGHVRLGAQYTDSTGHNASTIPYTVFLATSLTIGAWTKLTVNMTTPVGYDGILPLFWYVYPPTGDVIYLDNALVREVSLTQSTINSLFTGGAIASTIMPTAVPGLDASKITTGTFAQSMISGLTTSLNTLLPTTTYQSLVDGIANALGHSGTGHTWTDIETYLGIIPAANLTGALSTATVPGSQLTGSVASSLLSGAVALGLIPALPASQITSGTLGTGLIPTLDASKITTGTFAQSMISGLTSLWNSWFGTTTPTGTSTLAAANVAPLPASQITSGTFGTGLIPALDASKITSGSLTGATVPGSQLTGSVASSLLSGAVALGLIPALPATQITSGTLSSSSMVPVLDASKITTGTFAQSMISGLTSLWNSWFGTSTPTGTEQLLSGAVPTLDASKIGSGSLTGATVPGSQLTGSVASSLLSGAVALGLIPALPATQITSGTLSSASMVPALDASKITSGSLTGATVPGSQLTGSVLSSLLSGAVALGLIPALPASQITSGTFGTTLIPALDASKITTGALAAARVGALPASQITSGTFLSSFFPAFGASQVAGTNLVLDPGFETASMWAHATGGAISTDFAHGGTHSWKITGNGGNIPLLMVQNDVTQTIFLRTAPGEIFQVGAWIYPAAANVGGGTQYFYLYCVDSTGVNAPVLVLSSWAASTLTKGVWTYKTANLTVPAGYDQFYCYYQHNAITSGDIYYIDDLLLREVSLVQATINSLFSGGTVASTVQAAAVPALDASKITTGALAAARVAALPASQITTGTFTTGLIPSLDASKITSGSLTGATVPGSQLTGSVASSLLSGLVALGLIPSLPATQITSGTLSSASMVPALDASKITSGSLTGATVPGSQLTGSVASSLLSGAVALGLIPSLPASQITSGTLSSSSMVPTLDASKIGTGQFGTAQIPNISAGTGAGQSSDLQTTLDNIVSQFLQNGGTTSGNTPANAATAMSAIQNTVTALGSKVQSQLTGSNGNAQSGKAYTVVFNSWPAGSFSQAPFTCTKTGSGTGGLVLSNGDATWNKVANGDVQLVGIYTPSYALTFTGTPTAGTYTITYVNPDTGVSATTSAITYTTQTAASIQTALQALSNMPASGVTVVANPAGGFTITLAATGWLSIGTSSLTGGAAVMTNTGYTDTDYQLLQAQLAALPNGAGSKNYAILHANAAGTTYVYGLVYLSANWTLNWELGCYIAGVHYVWASGTNAPLNLAFTFAAGVGGNPNRYQGISGNTIVFDHTNVSGDPGGVFPTGASQRYWGFRSDTASSGSVTPAPASYVGCSDNSPPVVPGSSFRQYSTAASTSGFHNAGFCTLPSATWFNTNAILTSDLTYNSSTGSVVVSIPGTYSFKMRQSVSAISLSSGSFGISPAFSINRGGVITQYVCESSSWWANAVGAQVGPATIAGSMDIQLLAGDVVTPQYYVEAGPNGGVLTSISLIGDANGRLSWWSLTLDNCSYN